MKKKIITFTIVAVSLICSYALGTTQTKTITEIQTEIKEVIPDGYIQANDSIIDIDTIVDYTVTDYGLQLYFEDGTGYWLEK